MGRQLLAMPRATPPTVNALMSAGRYCGLADLRCAIDNFIESVDVSGQRRGFRDAVNLQLALVLALCVRFFAVKRPSALACLVIEGGVSQCLRSDCGRPGCTGNTVALSASGGAVLTFVHFKTQRSTPGERLVVPAGSVTEKLLLAHIHWGRSVLAGGSVSHSGLWITRGGAPMTARTLAATLTRAISTLLNGTRLGFNELRHLFATAAMASELSEKELEQLAAAMQTSLRKLKEVYQLDGHAQRCAAGHAVHQSLIEGTGASGAGRLSEPVCDTPHPPAPPQPTALPPLWWVREDEEFHPSGDVSSEDAEQYGDMPETTEDPPYIGGSPTPNADPIDLDQFLFAGAGGKKRGRPTIFKRPPDGMRHLTASEVESLHQKGGLHALQNAFTAVYKPQAMPARAASAPWLKQKLQRD